MKSLGIKPLIKPIRGGTDGSRLSFMGLPCPNIFAGEHAFHSRHEWVSVQDMRKAVEINQGRAKLEASGGVTDQTLRPIAETGVDYISIGVIINIR